MNILYNFYHIFNSFFLFFIFILTGALELLHLEYCNIGAIGCKQISKVLEFGGTQLKELSLMGNPIGGVGLIHIGGALKKNAILETLNLRGKDVIEAKVYP